MAKKRTELLRIGLWLAALLCGGLACNLFVPAAPTLPPTLPSTPMEEVTLSTDATVPEESEGSSTEATPAQDPGVSQEVVVASGGSIEVALMGPMSGTAGNVMAAIEVGVRQAVADFGPVAGSSVQISTFDTDCSAGGGSRAAEQVVAQSNVIGVIGPTCSVGAEGVLPILEPAGIVVVSPSTTRPNVDSYGPTVFNRVVLHNVQPGSEEGAEVDDLDVVQAFYRELGASLDEDSRFFAAYAYDAARILLQSIQEVGETQGDGSLLIDRGALLERVRATEGFEGVTGTISFDNSGNRVP